MKTVIQLILLMILIVTGVVVYGLHLGSSDNPINTELRNNVLKSTLTKSVLALNDPGDHKFMYASRQTDSLTVEVDLVEGVVPNNALESWIQGMVKETVGKRAEVIINYDSSIIPKNAYTYTELLSLAKKSRDPLLATKNNYLHIVYLTSSANEPTNSGMVLTATDIFIFKDVINGLSDRESIRSRIEHSTIKHEWGHLLGVDHLDRDDCVMSSKVEVSQSRHYQDNTIPIGYCMETLFQIEQVKKEANRAK